MDDNVAISNKYGYQRGCAFLLDHVYGFDIEERPQRAPAQHNFSCLGCTVASKIALN